jgi:hypothetical protein
LVYDKYLNQTLVPLVERRHSATNFIFVLNLTYLNELLKFLNGGAQLGRDEVLLGALVLRLIVLGTGCLW